VTEETRQRLFETRSTFDDPFVVVAVLAVVAILALTPVIVIVLDKTGKVRGKLLTDLWERYYSWLVLAPLIIVPVLLGAAYAIVAVGVLSLLCYREYARATGLFRETPISVIVVLGILLVTFASLDHWYPFFTALWPLTVGLIAAVAIAADRPSGYIQRVGLGVLGFILFGACLGHLGFFANDPKYRRIMLWIVGCVELNDVFAYICGKAFGRRKLAPNTSPNKTIGGAVGALMLTTILAAWLGSFVFQGTPLAQWRHLIVMGILISALGQSGDLLLSSVKRDVGIKDMGSTFPGHGGVLDRFNSLLLVAPGIFHYVNYYLGVGAQEQVRIFTGPLGQ
jgi:phosphatidate cytidylyltransferase